MTIIFREGKPYNFCLSINELGRKIWLYIGLKTNRIISKYESIE